MLRKVFANLAAVVLPLIVLAAATIAAEGGETPLPVVELELTYPAGWSPRVFTTGWVFGARAMLISPDGGETNLSNQVQWSGSGTFLPAVGAGSRPTFRAPGSNTIGLSITIGEQVIRRE